MKYFTRIAGEKEVCNNLHKCSFVLYIDLLEFLQHNYPDPCKGLIILFSLSKHYMSYDQAIILLMLDT